MKLPPLSPAKLKVLVVLLPLGALLLWVALRTGPMAPIPVTEVQVRQQALTPQLFGLGMVQARQPFKIYTYFSPTFKNVLPCFSLKFCRCNQCNPILI